MGVNTNAHQNIWEETQKINAGEKTVEKKETILLESMERLR